MNPVKYTVIIKGTSKVPPGDKLINRPRTQCWHHTEGGFCEIDLSKPAANCDLSGHRISLGKVANR